MEFKEMALIFEDSEKVTKKQIPIPQNAKNVFKAMKKIYEPYLDKNIRGSKIMKSLGSDKKYNKKGKNATFNGDEIKQDSVNVDDAKIRLHRMNKLPKDSVEYQLNGGELAANIYRKGIERARGTKEVEAVKPPKPTSNINVRPSQVKRKDISTPNGKITYSVTTESRVINEDSYDSEHMFYDYLSDYGVEYVFSEFMQNPHGRQSWGTLINPNMYAKALREFTQYGQLVKFPSKYIYQWMGIIMKNTAILCANTELAGHTSNFPFYEMEEIIKDYFGKDRDIEFIGTETIKIEITPQEMMSLLNDKNPLIQESVVDKYGQTYFPWMTQDDVNRQVAKADAERFKEKYGEIIERYNSENRFKQIEVNEHNGKIYWVMEYLVFFDEIGIYDWMLMPDGSEAWSDFGIRPLMEILSEYDGDSTPEETLVLVNRALDVYHQRGDMASIFIQGGRKSLSQISENKIRRGRKIYMTEKQIVKNGKYI